jgi:SAM-dependent methyltransferase
MDSTSSPVRNDAELLETNQRFYDGLWTDARLVEPERFNTWPLVSVLAAQAPRRLEVAPGLRPRLPIAGTQFVDISEPALAKLRARGAQTTHSVISSLPFADGAFDLVCALDIVEHVDDDDRALAELSRVAAPGAALLLSTPLHPAQWTAFDDFVGHRRRYEPQQILDKLARHGFAVEQSAVFGMKPKSSRLVDLGMWFLVHRRERAMWMYNRVMMPLGVRFQKKLTLVAGMVDTENVAEVLMVCRKQGAA